MSVIVRICLIGAGLVVALGCTPTPVSRVSLFSVPGGPTPPSEFYELPFPNDIRRGTDGHPDLSDYRHLNSLVDKYAVAISAGVDGFGLNSSIFVRFAGPIDTASLPATPDGSLADDASVYLVNVDPTSPDRGRKIPLKIGFEPKEGSTIGPWRLSALPYPGFPLDEGTVYALIVTSRVRVPGAMAPIAPSSDFTAILASKVPTDPALAAAQRTYSPLWSYLDEPGGDERSNVVNAAVFTTQHATRLAALLREKVWSLPPPAATGIALVTTFADYMAYDGEFLSPNFQIGDPPYVDIGGQIELGNDGLPVVQRMELLRVSFCVPAGEMPPNGWPVTIFAAGAGGDYHSYNDVGVAPVLAARGVASISIDQVLSGPRNPNGPSGDAAFYNISNPQAARYNALQGAADDFSLLRLVLGLLYADSSEGTRPIRTIRFDPTRIYFFGHSQGGVTGAPFLAFEPEVKAAILSGTGALLYDVLLNKTQPLNTAVLLKSFIPDNPLDEFNPVLALIQTWMEGSDPVNYGPLLARRTVGDRTGAQLAPKDIYQSEGFVDRTVPNVSIEAFATAVGGNQVFTPDGGIRKVIDGLTLRGRDPLTAPTSGNLAGKTVVLLQYEQPPSGDGHFVALYDPTAQLQWSQFLATKARTGIATLVTP